MVNLSVCIGSSCYVNGSHNVVQTFLHMIEDNGLNDLIEFKATFCMGNCKKEGVSVCLNGEIFRIDALKAREFFTDKVMPAINIS